ncbi:MAG: ATPase domain-containing protein [Candidatus Burarchaeum sp.]|nr:ATPase domain-containing protein [Candidatus Burarchaeum sp.]MDO8340137.1 ATPase domain-containing protein [Candidatus Burarchaeum sp.]
MAVVPTGIGKLDELVGGGLEKGSSALIHMTPGLEGATFAQQILLEGLKNGLGGIYVVNNKAPASVLDATLQLNWNAKLFGKVKFVDCFSSTLGQASDEKYVTKTPWDLKELDMVIAKAVKENREAVLVFDSLSTLVERKGEKEVMAAIKGWKDSAKKMNVTALYLFTDWSEKRDVFNRIAGAFDYGIMLKAVEEKMLLRNYFSVEKAPTKVQKVAVPFKIGPDGVAIYVPKILVTGPFHAGKSSFIHAISTRAVSVDRMGTTIALDHGYVDRGGMSIDLFGTPGQERFTFMIDILNRDVFGIILVVDSMNPEIERAVEMLKYVERYGIPLVVAANKQDVKGAMKPQDMKNELVKRGIVKDISVVGTSAATKEGCIELVNVLMDAIIGVKHA